MTLTPPSFLQLFSRKPGETVYKNMKSLGVQFAVLDKDWCIKKRPRAGCAIPEIWDFLDPKNAGKNTFCDEVPMYRYLFDTVFRNSHYRVLKLK